MREEHDALGKLDIEKNALWGIHTTYRLTRAEQPKGLNMLNGDDYTMMMKQALFNSQQDKNAANVPELSYNTTFSEYENFNNNTDWVKEVTRIGYTNDHNLTVFGGGERATFRVSGGFLDQKGTIIGTGFKRMSTRANMDYSVSDRLKVDAEFSFVYSDTDKGNGKFQNKDYNLLGMAYVKMPNVSVYQQDSYGNNTGKFYTIPRTSTLDASQRDLVNPVALASLYTNNAMNYRITPIFRLQYDLMDPNVNYLRYNAYFTFDASNGKNKLFWPWDATNNTWSETAVNNSTGSDWQNTSFLIDNNLTWKPTFDNRDHSLLLYASFQMRSANSSSQGLTTYGIPSQSSYDPSQAATLTDMSTSRGSSRGIGILGRAHYSYKSRYILSATLRRDGSTKFGTGRRWGDFPAISVKWIVSDEPFMDFAKDIVSMFALRPNWGLSGREPNQDYLHYSRYANSGSYLGTTATVPSSLRLPDLKWETNSTFNYGADLAFLDDRFVFDFNAYNKRTDDLLFEKKILPGSSGYANISWSNVGTMDNYGYELNFYANRAIEAGKFTVDLNFNISNNINKIVDLDDAVLDQLNPDFEFNNGKYLTRLEEGHSYGSIYGFRYKGVYRYDEYIAGVHEDAPVARDAQGRVLMDERGEPLLMTYAYGTTSQYTFRGGDAIYEDINHDGTIDELDIVYLGNSNPLFNGGFGTTMRYKAFSCVMFFNFRVGNKIVNGARMTAENMYGYDNQSIAVNWRWRKDGDQTEIPRALYQYGFNWLGSDRFVEDGSFLRFKYLQFNYTVPPSSLKRYKLDKLSFYLNFNNLAVFTKYTGVDPEIGYGGWGVATDNSRTPRAKDVTLGISVGL